MGIPTYHPCQRCDVYLVRMNDDYYHAKTTYHRHKYRADMIFAQYHTAQTQKVDIFDLFDMKGIFGIKHFNEYFFLRNNLVRIVSCIAHTLWFETL